MDYLYDGSFDGLLTCIYLSYYQEQAGGIYPEDCYQFCFLTNSCQVNTEPEQASKVYDAVAGKISIDALRNVYYVFLSNHPEKERLILQYLRLGFKLGPQIDSYHTHKAVLPVLTTARKVTCEAHRFLGLLRFCDAGNYLYAVLEPDHNILVLLAEHFTDRLAGENFIIHDRRRGMALVYDRQESYLTELDRNTKVPVTESELFYQELWTKYFARIALADRKNPKLQAHFIPGRYRKNLVEFKIL